MTIIKAIRLLPWNKSDDLGRPFALKLTKDFTEWPKYAFILWNFYEVIFCMNKNYN